MDKKQLAIEKHREWKGKIEVISRVPVTNRRACHRLYARSGRTVSADCRK